MKRRINDDLDDQYSSEFIRQSIASMPLRTRLWVDLQMRDKESWSNGDYLGDREALKEQVNYLISEFEQFVKDGSPEGFAKLK